MSARKMRSLALLGFGLVSASNAYGQAPPADGTVTVTPPPAQGQVPPPAPPTQRVEPPVPLQPQPAPPPSEPTAEAPPTAAAPTDAAAAQGEPVQSDAEDKNGVAGWYPGFAIKSKDEKFKLRIGLNAAYRFEPYWVDGESQDRKTFFVLRPFIEGHIFDDWIRYWTSFEFAANPPYLLDSYIELMPMNEFGLRIGQQWTPLSRHEYFGPQEILFPEWAPVAEYFWTGRDKGITALGNIGEGKFEYWAGVYSGTPLRQFIAIDGNWVLEGRVTVSPMGPVAPKEFVYIVEDEVPFRLSFTLQGYVGSIESAEENFNSSSFRFDVTGTGERQDKGAVAADVWVQGGPVAALVEGYYRQTDPEGAQEWNSMGVWGQAGVMVVDRTVDVGVRANLLDASDDLDNDMFASIEGQVGFYPVHTQNLQFKLRYGYAHQEDPGVEGAPLFTVPGDHQLITAQLMLAF